MADEKGKSTEDLSLDDFLKKENIVLTDKNLSGDKKELIASKYSVSDLIKFSSAASGTGKETIKSNILSILEIKDKQNTDALENIQKEKEGLEGIQKQKDEYERRKVDDIDALKKLLGYDDDDKLNKNNDNNEVVEALLGAISMNEKNNKTLEDIKDLQGKLKKARDDNNLEEVANINEQLEKKKGELIGLIGQKDDLYYKYFRQKQDYDKYDDNKGKGIQEFRRRGALFCNGDKLEGGGEVMFGIKNPLKQKRIARMRLNRVIQQMNKIGKDSTAGMKMVMNRCHLNGINLIGRGFKDVANTFRLKDPAKFSKQYDEQVQIFIRDLTKKLETAKGFDNDDKQTIALIEKRLKRYKQDYKQKFLLM